MSFTPEVLLLHLSPITILPIIIPPNVHQQVLGKSLIVIHQQQQGGNKDAEALTSGNSLATFSPRE